MTVSNRPAIIKRKRIVAAGGHHGGAWKVAYADFVTAMMAFFMLMWLLGATTEKQRKGIADYFNPTVPVNRVSGGGDGAFGGDSVFSEETFAYNGTGASDRHPSVNLAAPDDAAEGSASGRSQQDAEFRALEEMLLGRGGESELSPRLARHILTRVTDEGLIVELYDVEGAALFAPGTDRPEPVLDELVALVARVFGLVTNGVAVGGHVAASPEVLRVDPAWDLSTARAQAVRAALEAAGLAPARVQRVTGHAARRPAAPNPMAVRNNRIEVILLRSDVG
jgi:chemotaxis protein MotB